MNKRIRKKHYKAILKAKNRLNTWDGDFIKAIWDGYLNGQTRETMEGRAIRQVVNASTINREWKGWGFSLPTTKEAMQAHPTYNLTIEGKLYNGHSDFSECPEATLTVNVKRLMNSKEYLHELMSHPTVEFLEDFMNTIDERGFVA